MKKLDFYTEKQLVSEDQIFDYLLETLRPGVTDWEYFVNWEKVFHNVRSIETTLNTMNYLLGKDDFDSEFQYLAGKHPEIISIIPVLVVRNGSGTSGYQVVTVNGSILEDELFDFSKEKSSQDIDAALKFIRKSGLIKIFERDGVKNLVDYVLGVEAGLSSNGRKNRGGTGMEKVCEALLTNLGVDYIRQATQSDIEKAFGFKLTGNEGRIFDFVVSSQGTIFIIEVNCYSGGGSKLDKTASDYRSLNSSLRGQCTFVWLTDGFGWRKTKNPLRKTFQEVDYILNVSMVRDGALKEIFQKKQKL